MNYQRETFYHMCLRTGSHPHPRIRSFFHKTDICEIYLSYQLPLTILTKIILICIDYIKLDPMLSWKQVLWIKDYVLTPGPYRRGLGGGGLILSLSTREYRKNIGTRKRGSYDGWFRVLKFLSCISLLCSSL